MSAEYNDYLHLHRMGVLAAFQWIRQNMWEEACDILPDCMTKERVCWYNIKMHDTSKWDDDEYDAYDKFFYDKPNADSKAFNYAWLRHIHKNPHHWQHWVLMFDDGKYRDPGKITPLEMPDECILEMVCDWWSFSWRQASIQNDFDREKLYGIFDWYDKHTDSIILAPGTRQKVDCLLGNLREHLDCWTGPDD